MLIDIGGLKTCKGSENVSPKYRAVPGVCSWLLESVSVPCLASHWLRLHHRDSKELADLLLGSCLLPLLSFLLAPQLLAQTAGILTGTQR